jgi:hypothetical protein
VKQPPDSTTLGSGAGIVIRSAGLLGVVGLASSLAVGLASAGGYRRFLFAYLVASCFCLTIALGGLIFVLLQHLTRAGWSVTVRRPAEAVAATLPILGVLSLPILVSVAMQNGELYRWALPVTNAEVATGPAAVEQGHEKTAEQVVRAADHDPAQRAPSLDELTLKKRAWLNPTFFIIRVLIYFAVWTLIARF